jgi:hypothetical protein
MNKEVEYPLRGIFNLQGEYERCTVLFHDCATHIPVDKAYSINVCRFMQYNEPIRTLPILAATGSTLDISPFLQFTWCKPVYYKVDDSDFPSDTWEK